MCDNSQLHIVCIGIKETPHHPYIPPLLPVSFEYGVR